MPLNTTISGPALARQRRFADVPMMAQHFCFVVFKGSGPVLLRNPIFFVIFRGGSAPPAERFGLRKRKYENCVMIF